MKKNTFKLIALILCISLYFHLVSCNKNDAVTDLLDSSEQYLLIDGSVPVIYDSVNFLNTEKAAISSDPNTKVIKLYVDVFFRYYSAASIATRGQSIGRVVYMLVSDNGEITFKNPISDFLSSASINSKFFLYALEPHKVFDPSTKICNTYCIIEFDHSPCMNIICFSTQNGEKFLVTGCGSEVHSNCDTIYLFSAAEFYKRLDIISDDLKAKYEGSDSKLILGGYPNIITHFSEEELSEFVFTPRE